MLSFCVRFRTKKYIHIFGIMIEKPFLRVGLYDRHAQGLKSKILSLYFIELFCSKRERHE